MKKLLAALIVTAVSAGAYAQSNVAAPEAADHAISTRGTVAHKVGHKHHHAKHHAKKRMHRPA